MYLRYIFLKIINNLNIVIEIVHSITLKWRPYNYLHMLYRLHGFRPIVYSLWTELNLYLVFPKSNYPSINDNTMCVHCRISSEVL